MSRVVYSLMFGLHDYVGHIYQYHLSISKVCNINSWKHIGLVPKDCKIDIPSSWEKALAKGGWQNKSLKQNLISTWKNFLFFKKFLKDRKSNDILFIESFSLFNVLSLILSLSFARTSCEFWVLHRFAFPKYGIKTLLYKVFHWMVKMRVGKGKLVLLTDSDLLAKAQSALFKANVTVVPIPHTNVSGRIKNKHSEEVSLWWPGGSTRWDKGLDYIKLLSKQLQAKKDVKLIVANSAKGKIFNSENVVYLPTSLSSDEYYKLMKSVSLILLPYIPSEYKLRTSGIFVEAITSGAKVITFKNTWMAYELGKYGLNELAINPEEFSLDLIMQVAKLNLNSKINFMKNAYNAFHSERCYANAIKSLSFKHS